MVTVIPDSPADKCGHGRVNTAGNRDDDNRTTTFFFVNHIRFGIERKQECHTGQEKMD